MPFRYRLMFFIIITFWMILIFSQPIAKYFEPIIITFPFSQIIFSNVCHQQPEKLINIGKYSTFVCARCTGIYSGVFFTSFLILVISKFKQLDTKYLVISFLPMLVDVFSVNIGIYSYSKTIALITGLILGSSVFYYFYKVISSQFGKKN